jgi:two-component system NtrC family sensor kinase
MKVLVAEDDLVSRRLISSYLQKWGYEAVLTTDGAEAWRAFEVGDFPLVITDWVMPEVDGLELIRRIRASGRGGYVFTLLLTAKFQKEDLVRGMEAGADDFLSKPFDRDELRVRLRAAERVVELERQLRAAQAQATAKLQPTAINLAPMPAAQEAEAALREVLENLSQLRGALTDGEPTRLVDQAVERLERIGQCLHRLDAQQA